MSSRKSVDGGPGGLRLRQLFQKVSLKMVHIDRIYTRSGDSGETGLADGSRVSKLDLRIVAGGSVDETNSHLGVAASHCESGDVRDLLHSTQQQLFDLGADLSFPWPDQEGGPSIPRITADHVEWLERQIDTFNEEIPPLKSFVLPGGCHLAAALHVARSVCRRSEVDVLRLGEETQLNPQLMIYLNRLSDLLFVLTRYANDKGENDVLWEPGRALPTE